MAKVIRGSIELLLVCVLKVVFSRCLYKGGWCGGHVQSVGFFSQVHSSHRRHSPTNLQQFLSDIMFLGIYDCLSAKIIPSGSIAQNERSVLRTERRKFIASSCAVWSLVSKFHFHHVSMRKNQAQEKRFLAHILCFPVTWFLFNNFWHTTKIA